MNSLKIYLKHQSSYLLQLVVVFVIPLALFFQFSTYEIPKVQYAFLVLLFGTQYVFYREKDFQRKIEKSVAESLKRELGRTPSNKEINNRLIKITYYRGVSIIITALSIIALMLIFQKF